MILISCSKNLNRDIAADLIRKKYKLPAAVTEEIQIGTVNLMRNFGGANTTTYEALANAGIITFKFVGKRSDAFFKYSTYEIELLPKGEQFVKGSRVGERGEVLKSMFVGEWDLAEVTGINETVPEQKATVEYTWRYSNVTPVGIAIGEGNKALNRKDPIDKNRPTYDVHEIIQSTELMVRYDDGWRLLE